jgi:hypothetical protein
VGVAVLVGVAFFYSEIMLLLIAGVYVLQGLTLQLVRVVRHRLAARPA